MELTNFLITLIIGFMIGWFFLKLKVPGGMMIGSIVGVSIFNMIFDFAYVPYYGRTIAQIVAGAFIGTNIEKGDIKRLKYIYKPAIILLFGLLFLNLVSGFIIYFLSPLDLMTSLMSAIPGGLSDLPIISEEFGADSSKVALMQFIRLIFGVGIFPSLILKISKIKRFKNDREIQEDKSSYKRIKVQNKGKKNLFFTIFVACIFGMIGKASNIPAATMIFSILSILILKLKTEKAYIPVWMRRLAQVLAGSYIGSTMGFKELLEIKYLMIPALILILGYFIMCFVLGNILSGRYRLSLKEGMLAATPAGASDMALISTEMGIDNADIIVLHIIRMVAAASIFPHIVRIINLFFLM
jgi:hypothetical protein